MIINLSFLYQLIFNSIHFSLIMPFIIRDESINIGVLYLCASLPSFILTIPLNNLLNNQTIKHVLLGSSILCSFIALLLFKLQSFIVICSILVLRSTIGCIFVPKVAQFVGTTKNRTYSTTILQFILFLPGTVGYMIAIILFKLNIINIMILIELCIVAILAFALRKENKPFKKSNEKNKTTIVMNKLILFETILITIVTFLSLFYLSEIIKSAQLLSLNKIILFGLIQLVIIFIVHIIKHKLSFSVLFLMLIILAITIIIMPNTVVSIILIFSYLFIIFFINAQNHWHHIIDQRIQHSFFAQRLVITHSPKFIMCLVPSIHHLI